MAVSIKSDLRNLPKIGLFYQINIRDGLLPA